jgi:hypothetical protein
MKLNKDLIMKENTVVHARTEEEAKVLCDWADGEGLGWCTGEKYKHCTGYSTWGNDTCYMFISSEYYDVDFCREKNYTILTLDDITTKETTVEKQIEIIEAMDAHVRRNYPWVYEDFKDITIKEEEMEEMLVADFRDVKKSDKLKSLNGYDIIIHEISDHFLVVGEKEQNNTFQINLDGYKIRGLDIISKAPIVFYHFEGQFPTIEATKRPLPKIEKDEKVLVWDEEQGRFLNAHFKLWMDSGKMSVYPYGSNSWSNRYPSKIEFYKYWKRFKDETINSGNLEEIEG